MPNTETAGNSLPQDCAALEQFVTAQAHIIEAARIIDRLTVIDLSHLSKHEQDSFRNLAETTRSTLWETYSDAQDLLSAYLIPKYPANLKKS